MFSKPFCYPLTRSAFSGLQRPREAAFCDSSSRNGSLFPIYTKGRSNSRNHICRKRVDRRGYIFKTLGADLKPVLLVSEEWIKFKDYGTRWKNVDRSMTDKQKKHAKNRKKYKKSKKVNRITCSSEVILLKFFI